MDTVDDIGSLFAALPAGQRRVLYLVSLHAQYLSLSHLRVMAHDVWPESGDDVTGLIETLEAAGGVARVYHETLRMTDELTCWLDLAEFADLDRQERYGCRQAFCSMMSVVAASIARLPVAEQRAPMAVHAENLQRAMVQAERLRKSSVVVSIAEAIASHHEVAGSFERASCMWQRMLALSLAAGDAGGAARALLQLGRIARRLGDVEDAERCLRGALKALDADASMGRVGMSGETRGTVLVRCRGSGFASFVPRHDGESKRSQGELLTLASVFIELGSLEVRRVAFEGARTWVARALAVLDEVGDHAELESTYRSLARVAHASGQTELVRNWGPKAVRLRFGEGKTTGVENEVEVGVCGVDFVSRVATEIEGSVFRASDLRAAVGAYERYLDLGDARLVPLVETAVVLGVLAGVAWRLGMEDRRANTSGPAPDAVPSPDELALAVQEVWRSVPEATDSGSSRLRRQCAVLASEEHPLMLCAVVGRAYEALAESRMVDAQYWLLRAVWAAARLGGGRQTRQVVAMVVLPPGEYGGERGQAALRRFWRAMVHRCQ